MVYIWYKGFGVAERYPDNVTLVYISAHENRHKTRLKMEESLEKDKKSVTVTTYRLDLSRVPPLVVEGRTRYMEVKKKRITLPEFIKLAAERIKVLIEEGRGKDAKKILSEIEKELEKKKEEFVKSLLGGEVPKDLNRSGILYAKIYNFIYEAIKNPELYGLDERNVLVIPLFLDAVVSGKRFVSTIRNLSVELRARSRAYLRLMGDKAENMDKGKWEGLQERLSNLEEERSSTGSFLPYRVSSSGEIEVEVKGVSQEGRYRIELLQKPEVHEIASDPVDDPYSPLGLTGTMKINGVHVDVEGSDSLWDIKEKINQLVDKVEAFIKDSSLHIKSLEPYPSRINLSGDTDLLEALGLFKNVPVGKYILKHEISEPQEAVINVNGETMRSPDGVFNIDGNLEVKVEGNGAFSVWEDITDVYSSVESLLEAYNRLVDYVNEMLSIPGFSEHLERMVKFYLEESSKNPKLFEKVRDRMVLSEPFLIAMGLDKDSLKDTFSTSPFSYITNLSRFGLKREDDGKFSLDRETLKRGFQSDFEGTLKALNDFVDRIDELLDNLSEGFFDFVSSLKEENEVWEDLESSLKS